jgi:hypothetical protein
MRAAILDIPVSSKFQVPFWEAQRQRSSSPKYLSQAALAMRVTGSLVEPEHGAATKRLEPETWFNLTPRSLRERQFTYAVARQELVAPGAASGPAKGRRIYAARHLPTMLPRRGEEMSRYFEVELNHRHRPLCHSRRAAQKRGEGREATWCRY